jgi:hypothetical protein
VKEKAMSRRPTIDEEHREQLTQDYEEIGNIPGVAEKWGVGVYAVTSALRRFGINPKKKPRDGYHPKLGIWSDNRVAKELGVSHQAVGMARKRRGIESPFTKLMKKMSKD